MPREAILRAADRSAQSATYPEGRLRDWVRERLQRWPPDGAGPAFSHRVEKIIANSRALLAVVVILALYLDHDGLNRLHRIVNSLSAGYLIYCLAVLSAVRSAPPSKPWIRVYQTIDLLIPVALMALTAESSSPFFILLLFGVIFSAIRSGLAGAMVYGAIAVSLLLGIRAIAYLQAWPSEHLPSPTDPNLLLARSSYALVIALVVGYLAEGRRQIYTEQAAIGLFLRLGRSGPSLNDSLQRVFDELMLYYPAREILLAVQDGSRQRAWLWRSRSRLPSGPSPGDGSRPTKLNRSDWPLYFGPRPGPCWQQPIDASDPLFARHPCRSLLGCDANLGSEFYIRLLILDPEGVPLPARRLNLLKKITVQLGPPLLSEYLLERLRRHAQEQGRARLARELHDGIAQSLLGLELEVESYRRGLPQSDVNAQRFETIRDQLHDSIIDLRGLMGELHVDAVTPISLAAAIRQSAARLTRETGVPVQLDGLNAIDAPNERSAREIGLFVHEALINIRKHSSATKVTIAYREGDHRGILSVTDDGKGFDFTGTLQGLALEEYEHLPVMLLTRARAVGAEMILHSRIGGGASIALEWPLEARPPINAARTNPSANDASIEPQVLKYLKTVPSKNGADAPIESD